MYKFLSIICIITVLSCKSKSSSETIPAEEQTIIELDDRAESEEQNYEDGEYCASIDYYNPETGTSSNYNLTIEVQDGELTQINWSNGGWLDGSHFSEPTLEEDGSCSFTTYDGKRYQVQIEEEGSCSYSSSSPQEDDDDFYETQRLESEEVQEQEVERLTEEEEQRLNDENQETEEEEEY